MDLAKLLKLKTKGPSQADGPHGYASLFLAGLAQTLRSDIATLTKLQPEDEWVRLARIMKVYTGNLNERADPVKEGTTYLFLNVPSQRGLMLEASDQRDRLELRKGSRIVPLKRNAFEELEATTLFVTAGPLLDDFALLHSDTVRSRHHDRTLTVSMMSEHLLSLAFGLEEHHDSSLHSNPL